MQTTGAVRIWHGEEGWGVIDSQQTPGGCWVHFADLAVPGYRSLEAGQEVVFEWETADQDGYSFRATRAWPAGSQPHMNEPTPNAGHAYSSKLTIHFDN